MATDHKPDSAAPAGQPRQHSNGDKPKAESRSPTAEQLKSHPGGAIAGAAAGASAGAVTGIAAGPVGSLAGAIVGGVTGAVVGAGSSGASGGQPVQPGIIDDQAEAAAPSIQKPKSGDAPDKSKPP
jgi:phage tail tape-measure protein